MANVFYKLLLLYGATRFAANITQGLTEYADELQDEHPELAERLRAEAQQITADELMGDLASDEANGKRRGRPPGSGKNQNQLTEQTAAPGSTETSASSSNP
jgi:hypothetical protein